MKEFAHEIQLHCIATDSARQNRWNLRCAPQLRWPNPLRAFSSRKGPFDYVLFGGEGGIDSAASAASGLKPSHLRCAPQLRWPNPLRAFSSRKGPFDYVLFGGEGGIDSAASAASGLKPSHLRCAPQLRWPNPLRAFSSRKGPFDYVLFGGEGGIDSAASAASGLKPSHLRCAPQLRWPNPGLRGIDSPPARPPSVRSSAPLAKPATRVLIPQGPLRLCSLWRRGRD